MDIIIIVVSTILVTLIAGYFDFFEWFLEWSRKHESMEIDEIIAATINLAFIFGIRSAIIRHKLKNQLQKTSLAEAELARQLNEKVSLLREVNHRVKNNLTLIRSLAFLKSKDTSNPETKSALEEIESQINAISKSHELLSFESSKNKIDLKEYLEEVGKGVLYGCGRTEDISLICEKTTTKLNQKTSTYVGLIFTELILNSVKHAFPDGKKGQIQLNILTQPNDTVQITVSDNGPGKKNLDIFKYRGSIGLGLIQEIVENQLSGKVDYITSDGFTTQLSIPMVA